MSIATCRSVRHPAMLLVVAKGRDFLYIQEVFSWDPKKAIVNFHKHGVPFEEAATVFANHDGKETVRIIGAGAASRKERQAYSRPGS